jgi:hypothetical protein
MSKLFDPKAQKQLVTDTWSQFAPFAYGRYLQRGRGGLLFKVSDLKAEDIEDDQILIDGDAVYVTADDIARGEVILPAGIEQEFAAYNPDLQVVFLFDSGAGVQMFRGAPDDQPSPKECYERQFN